MFGFGDVQQPVPGAAPVIADLRTVSLKSDGQVAALTPLADRGDGDTRVGGGFLGRQQGVHVKIGHAGSLP